MNVEHFAGSGTGHVPKRHSDSVCGSAPKRHTDGESSGGRLKLLVRLACRLFRAFDESGDVLGVFDAGSLAQFPAGGADSRRLHNFAPEFFGRRAEGHVNLGFRRPYPRRFSFSRMSLSRRQT